MMLTVYGTDRFKSAYEKGLFRHDVLTGWAMQNAGHPVTADYLESCRFRPHDKVDEALWGGPLENAGGMACPRESYRKTLSG